MHNSNNNLISFSWDLHYACNYRCPYCWFAGRWHELSKFNRYLSVEQWAKYWKNIYLRYGSVAIEILGGEPFIYPNFTELIKEISTIHHVGITTNLSTDIKDFINEIDPSNVDINPTFHPSFIDFVSFVKKALLLKEKGVTGNVLYLAYPPQIRQIPYYKERFSQNGLSLWVMTFWGEYKGVTYPEGYTEEEREIIGTSLGKRGGKEFQLIPEKIFKGKLCRAGQKYAVIQSDGKVLRCGGSGLSETIGNFFDEDFKLLEMPLPCKADYCRCNEWAFLLCEDNEEQHLKERNNRERRQLLELTPPHHVFFTWDIHYSCNYQCSYCNALKADDPNYIEAVYINADQWVDIWKRIYDSYGSCEIQLTGGEPFTYPYIIELITKLSKIHTLEFSTNFSCDIEPFIKNISPDRARIGVSFHPEFADFGEFLDKVSKIKKEGFEIWVNYVGHPALLEKMAVYKEKVEELGIRFSILPFTGIFEGRSYPAEYREEEKRYLLSFSEGDIINRKTVDWKLNEEDKTTEGKLCRMGQMYGKIYPNGKVYRCCSNGGSGYLGNLIEGTFRLLDSPLPCESNQCPCWRCMLVGEEQNWAKHWVIPCK